MSTPVEIETTILGGLPVCVTADIEPADRSVGVMEPSSYDVQIFWINNKKPKSHEVPKSIYKRLDACNGRELDLLNEKLMEEYRYGN